MLNVAIPWCFLGSDPHSKTVLPPYDFLPSWCHPKRIPLSFSQNCPPHVTWFQRTMRNTPSISYRSFQFKDMLLLSQSLHGLNLELSSQSNTYSDNLLFNSFGVRVSHFNQHMACYYFNCSAIFELHITHLKTGISLCLPAG